MDETMNPRQAAASLSRLAAVVLACVFLAGCYEHKVNTLETWCEQGTGDTEEKYQPFWAVIFSVKLYRDAVRDDYVKILNDAYMEKVQKRAPKMAWREGRTFHIVNLSSLLVTDPNDFISEWRKGIAEAQSLKPDRAHECLWDATFGLFDSVDIHSMVTDPVSANWGDTVTSIPTGRRQFYAKYNLGTEDMDGWYLMAPSLVDATSAYPACSHGLATNVNAPLLQWGIEGSFSTAKECETDKSLAREQGLTVAKESEKKASSMRKESSDEWSWSAPVCSALARGEQMSEAICVSADDSRLKGN
jgi:hypothetical protein